MIGTCLAPSAIQLLDGKNAALALRVSKMVSTSKEIDASVEQTANLLDRYGPTRKRRARAAASFESVEIEEVFVVGPMAPPQNSDGQAARR